MAALVAMVNPVVPGRVAVSPAPATTTTPARAARAAQVDAAAVAVAASVATASAWRSLEPRQRSIERRRSRRGRRAPAVWAAMATPTQAVRPANRAQPWILTTRRVIRDRRSTHLHRSHRCGCRDRRGRGDRRPAPCRRCCRNDSFADCGCLGRDLGAFRSAACGFHGGCANRSPNSWRANAGAKCQCRSPAFGFTVCGATGSDHHHTANRARNTRPRSSAPEEVEAQGRRRVDMSLGALDLALPGFGGHLTCGDAQGVRDGKEQENETEVHHGVQG